MPVLVVAVMGVNISERKSGTERTKKRESLFVSTAWGAQRGAGLNDGLFSETMDFRDFPSVLSAVRIAQS